jgi:hypothetical protein
MGVKCPVCGREIRYIVAAPSVHAVNGLVAVDVAERELVTEKGRLARGFSRHTCPPKENRCTISGEVACACHAVDGGVCRNEFACSAKEE